MSGGLCYANTCTCVPTCTITPRQFCSSDFCNFVECPASLACPTTLCGRLELDPTTTPTCTDLSGGGGTISASTSLDLSFILGPTLVFTVKTTVAPCGSPPYVSAGADITIPGSGITGDLETAVQAAVAATDSCLSYSGNTLSCSVKAELGGAAAEGTVPVVSGGAGSLDLKIKVSLTGSQPSMR